MSLMRGPQVEDHVEEEPKEEEKLAMRVLPALPSSEDTPPTQMQAFGLDITKEGNGE